MIASEKSHQNLSDYNQFSLKKIKVSKKQIFPGEKMIYSGNCIYDLIQAATLALFNILSRILTY